MESRKQKIESRKSKVKSRKKKEVGELKVESWKKLVSWKSKVERSWWVESRKLKEVGELKVKSWKKLVSWKSKVERGRDKNCLFCKIHSSYFAKIIKKNVFICEKTLQICSNFGLRLLCIPPKLRLHCCANNKAFYKKLQINLIFSKKSLYIPNFCSNFAAQNMCEVVLDQNRCCERF